MQTKPSLPESVHLSSRPPSDREYPARPIVGVGAVILVSPDDARAMGWSGQTSERGVVLVKRLFEPLAGQWSLPGGTVEVGETLAAGIAREVGEETGLTVDVGPIVDVFDRIVHDDAIFDRILHDDASRVKYHFVLVDYLCGAIGGRLRAGSDVGDVTVADPQDLAEFGLTEKTLDVIAKAVAMRKEKDGHAVSG